jgi:hypothetical protein
VAKKKKWWDSPKVQAEIDRLLAEHAADTSPLINLSEPGALDKLRKEMKLLREDKE